MGLRNFLKKIRGRLPSKLPQGSKEFDSFVESILNTYDIPNLPSYQQAVATMIMHLGPQISRAPHIYFARSIHKAMSNEVAYSKIQDIKKLLEEKAKKEKEESEATASAMNDGKQQVAENGA